MGRLMETMVLPSLEAVKESSSGVFFYSATQSILQAHGSLFCLYHTVTSVLCL